MSDLTSAQHGAGVAAPGQMAEVVAPVSARGVLFLAFLALTLISLSPFADLGDPKLLEVSEGNEVVSYALFLGLALAMGFTVAQTDRPALASLLVPSFVGLALWIGVSCLISPDPMTSIKRATMLVFVVTGCAALFLLPRDEAELTRLLSTLALVILALSYFGVIFLPYYAIHQPTDLAEPQLAGDWRGVFGHKNLTSAIFSVLTFVGLYVRERQPGLGWTIAVLSLIFVLASGGKSSTIICIVTIMLSMVSAHVASTKMFMLIVMAPMVALNLVGVGSVAIAPIGAFLASLPIDASFTGRTEVWAFAISHAVEKPFLGHGYLAFWNTEAMRHGGGELNTDWASTASHAHNGYLDVVLSVGFPGLALYLAAMVFQPARDVHQALKRNTEPALTLMFQRIWMFSLYLSAFESFVFNRAQPSWVLLLFAVFSLRYLAEFRVTQDAESA